MFQQAPSDLGGLGRFSHSLVALHGGGGMEVGLRRSKRIDVVADHAKTVACRELILLNSHSVCLCQQVGCVVSDEGG